MASHTNIGVGWKALPGVNTIADWTKDEWVTIWEEQDWMVW